LRVRFHDPASGLVFRVSALCEIAEERLARDDAETKIAHRGSRAFGVGQQKAPPRQMPHQDGGSDLGGVALAEELRLAEKDAAYSKTITAADQFALRIPDFV